MKFDEPEQRTAHATEDDELLTVEVPTNLKGGGLPACQCVTCCNNHSAPSRPPVKIGDAAGKGG